MCAKLGFLGLSFLLASAAAAAQEGPTTTDIYCSGTVTTDKVPYDTYLISGEQSNTKVIFGQGDVVYINKGSAQGVKVGDEFLVMRPVKDPLEVKWFTWQPSLLRAMGQTYADLGRLRVINVQQNVSVAEVVSSCDYMQRGDIVQPFAERPVPPYHDATKFDRFAPASGKAKAMVVTTRFFSQVAGANSIVYVNLGSAQGVKVGDYFRIFRYQATRNQTAYQTAGIATRLYGFGSAARSYKEDELPRETLGEGIVLRVSPNASTVLITLSLREIHPGDYVESE